MQMFWNLTAIASLFAIIFILRCRQNSAFTASAQSAGCFRPIAADAMRDLPLSKRP
jgi:hypothetical protein